MRRELFDILPSFILTAINWDQISVILTCIVAVLACINYVQRIYSRRLDDKLKNKDLEIKELEAKKNQRSLFSRYSKKINGKKR